MVSDSGKVPVFLKNREKLLKLSVRDLIDLRAKEIPDLPFLLTPINPFPINFQQLKDYCSRISTGLEALGVEEGQTVATMMPNGLASTLLNLSIFYKGKILCPLNLAAGDMQLSYVLEHSESRLLLLASELRARAEAILKTLPNPPEMVEIAADEIPFENAGNQWESENQTDALKIGLLMYTSGTTGKPKGVMLSHRSLISGGLNAMESHDLKPEDRALCVLPLYHINGLINTMMGPLVSGSSVFMPPKFKTSEFWGLDS